MISAIYRPSPIVRYAGNPLIEALPEPLTKEQIYRRFLYVPPIRPEELALPPEERRFAVNALFSFRQPLPIHGQLGLMLDELIREGYAGRNPLKPSTLAHTHYCITGGHDGVLPPTPEQLTAKTAFETGLSRQGKTSSVLRIASTNYPQAIQHTNYHGQALAEVQVVYLYVRIPANASQRDFVMAFFEALDRAVYGEDGTTFQTEAEKMERSLGRLIKLFRKLARRYHVGIILVDELQFLSIGRALGKEELRKFLHELVDHIGIPVLFIGTYKAYDILLKTLHETGRIVGLGKIDFAPPHPNSREWRQFMEGLWPCNWLKKQEPLTDSIIELVHDLVQGIYDFAVRLYVIAQMKAMANGSENVNAALLKSVMLNELSPLNPALDVLRSGSKDSLKQFEDLLPGASIIDGLVSSAAESLYAGRLADMVDQMIDKLLPDYLAKAAMVSEQKADTNVPRTDQETLPEVRSLPVATHAAEPGGSETDLRQAAEADDPIKVLAKMGALSTEALLAAQLRGKKKAGASS